MISASDRMDVFAQKLCPWLYPVSETLLRVASADHLSHASLLTGPAGIGKANLANFLAQRLLTAETSTAVLSRLGPQEAAAAMAIRWEPYDHHPDLHLVFPEEGKRTISVEQIREVSSALVLKGFVGSRKVVIIDPAETMTIAAANALLKTLEEPTDDTFLLLVSERPGLLPATIRSRCQRIDLRIPPLSQVQEWLTGLAHIDRSDVARFLELSYQGPLTLLTHINDGLSDAVKNFDQDLAEMANGTVDPLSVATRWTKQNPERTLIWLIRQIQLVIQSRFAAAYSNRVTVSNRVDLHNMWSELTLRDLFRQLDRGQALLDQLGSGTNIELAMQVLLLGFTANEGRM